MTTWISVPAWASGARALARIPVLFSTSFRHSTIFLTVTAMLSPSSLSKESVRGSVLWILLRTGWCCKFHRKVDSTLLEETKTVLKIGYSLAHLLRIFLRLESCHQRLCGT